MRVFGLAASPRHGGNSESLLDVVLAELKAAGHDVVKQRLTEHKVEPCGGHSGCRKLPQCIIEDDFPALSEGAMAADVVVFAIPVYYWGVPAQFKAFIDRHVHYYSRRKYAARAIGLIVVAGDDGIEETLDQMHSFLCKGGHGALPWSEVNILQAYASERGEALANPELVEKARSLGRRIAGKLA